MSAGCRESWDTERQDAEQQQPRNAVAAAVGDAEDQLHPAIFMRRRQQRERKEPSSFLSHGRTGRRSQQFFVPVSPFRAANPTDQASPQPQEIQLRCIRRKLYVGSEGATLQRNSKVAGYCCVFCDVLLSFVFSTASEVSCLVITEALVLMLTYLLTYLSATLQRLVYNIHDRICLNDKDTQRQKERSFVRANGSEPLRASPLALAMRGNKTKLAAPKTMAAHPEL